MKAYVIAPFRGVPDGEAVPRQFSIGDEIGGSLAEVAVREKWAAAHPLDHDGDGKPGGSQPAEPKKRKAKA